jgi:hypothetical protein
MREGAFEKENKAFVAAVVKPCFIQGSDGISI